MRTINRNVHEHDSIIVTKTLFHKHRGKYINLVLDLNEKTMNQVNSLNNKYKMIRKLPCRISQATTYLAQQDVCQGTI